MKSFQQFITEAYDKELEGQASRAPGEGGRIRASRKKREIEKKRTKVVDGKRRKYGIVYIRPDTKRGKRDMIMNGYTLLKVQQHLKKGIKIRND